jgi:hypothetical protein
LKNRSVGEPAEGSLFDLEEEEAFLQKIAAPFFAL